MILDVCSIPSAARRLHIRKEGEKDQNPDKSP